MTAPTPAARSHRALWSLARLLGGLGIALALLLTLGTWGLTLTLVSVLGGWLEQAAAGLGTLNGNLNNLIAAIEPLDILARPETLEAVRSLGDLSAQAREAPLIGAFLNNNGVTDAALGEVQMVADNWATLLESRPSVPELRGQQAEVQAWLTRVQTAQRWLTPAAWLLNLGSLLLGLWFAAGQWALMRLAGERLAALDTAAAKAARQSHPVQSNP